MHKSIRYLSYSREYTRGSCRVLQVARKSLATGIFLHREDDFNTAVPIRSSPFTEQLRNSLCATFVTLQGRASPKLFLSDALSYFVRISRTFKFKLFIVINICQSFVFNLYACTVSYKYLTISNVTLHLYRVVIFST